MTWKVFTLNLVMLLFELILLLLSTKSFWKYKEYFKIIPVKNNSIIAYGSIVAFLIVFFYFFSLGTEGARGGTKSVGEYRVLIMIIGLFFSNRQTKIKKIWTIVIIVTSVLVLISGNRVDIIAPIILLICFCYHDVVNYKKILSFFPLFVILFLFIGFVRGDRSKLYETRGEIQSVFQNFTDSKLVFSTPVWAYVPSVATIELTDKVDFKEKNQMFFEYLSYIFYAGFARSIDKTDFELSYYTGQYFSHNNGFVSPIYFFFWLGYLGVLLFAVLLKIYIVIYQHCFKAVVADYKSGLQYCVGFYFISSVGRWYLFGPHLLIRGMFILIVLYSAVYLGSLFLNRPLLPDEKSV